MIKLAVSGCLGRMGQRICDLAMKDGNFQLAAVLERPDHPQAGESTMGLNVSSSLDDLKGCDVLIDFTSPQAAMQNIEACVRHNTKLIIGTTGLAEEHIAAIQKASEKIPIVFSSNMSIGVNILFKLTELLAKSAPGMYSVNITEAHHVHKKDAPSGTAKTLAQKIEGVSTHKVENIESIRKGEIVGDHKITFESSEDIITIEHHAKSRDIFVKGSLVAAKFLSDKKDGLFSMQEVLGLA